MKRLKLLAPVLALLVSLSAFATPLASSIAYAQDAPDQSLAAPPAADASGATPAAGASVTTNQTQAQPDKDCDGGLLGVRISLSCFAKTGLSMVGFVFIAVGAGVLRLAGLIFDSLLYSIIINFKGTLQAYGLLGGITTGWTVFRDLSNIAIIASLVVIAISTILGLDKFGYKRLLARVLIVAALMNFSLLFAKLIIDASNFTAFQFYSQSAAVSGSVQAAQSGATNQYDIAQAFLTPMKIGTIGDTYNTVRAQANGNGTDNDFSLGFRSLFFGLIGGILLLGIAIVLIYGIFLIAARAVMLFFLMITASIAFASYLFPAWSDGEFGWKAWWRNLINCAVFAPLLMIFLTITLVLITAAGNIIRNNQSFGQLVDSASGTSAITGSMPILIVYLFAIGLLYASFRVSSHLAGQMSGFDFTSKALASSLRSGGSFVNRVGGRFGLGSRDAAVAKEYSDQAKQKMAQKRATPNIDAATSAKFDREIQKLQRNATTYREKANSNRLFSGAAVGATGRGIGNTVFGRGAKPAAAPGTAPAAPAAAPAATPRAEAAATPAPTVNVTSVTNSTTNQPAPQAANDNNAPTPAPRQSAAQAPIQQTIIETASQPANDNSRTQRQNTALAAEGQNIKTAAEIARNRVSTPAPSNTMATDEALAVAAMRAQRPAPANDNPRVPPTPPSAPAKAANDNALAANDNVADGARSTAQRLRDRLQAIRGAKTNPAPQPNANPSRPSGGTAA